jgi:hypothetical protein
MLPFFFLHTGRLFVSEGAHGIALGRPDGPRADRQKRDDQGGQALGQEDPHGDFDPVGECLEPLRHGRVSDRPSRGIGQHDPLHELARKQGHHPRRGGAERLADADLLGHVSRIGITPKRK